MILLQWTCAAISKELYIYYGKTTMHQHTKKQQHIPLYQRLSERRRNCLAFILCSAFFLELLSATALNTSLPQIAHSFHVSPITLRTILVCYLLSIGLLLPAAAYLADRFGMRRMFCFANILFLLGAVACGLSQNVSQMIVARVMQGIGGAFLCPVARMYMLHLYPKHELIRGQTISTSVASLGLLLGPLVGGFLTTFFSWHAIFFVNIPIVLLVLAVSYRYLPEVKSHSKASRFDLWGYLCLAIAIAGALFFIDTLLDASIAVAVKVFMFVLAAIAGIGYVLLSQRNKEPLFDAALWRQSQAMRWVMLSFLLRVAMVSVPFLLPIMLQSSYHMNAWHAGLSLMFPALGFGVARPCLQKLLHYFSRKQVVLSAMIAAAGCLALLTLQTVQLQWLSLALLLIVFGIAQSILVGLMNASVYQSVPVALNTQITVVNSAIIQLGACFAVTFASLLLILTCHHMPQAGHPILPSDFYWVFICEAALMLLGMLVLVFDGVCFPVLHELEPRPQATVAGHNAVINNQFKARELRGGINKSEVNY